MIKFNVECKFSKESVSHQARIVPQLENKPSGSESLQDSTKLYNISEELKELKKISERMKEMNDEILKAQEVLNLRLRENSKEITQVASNNKSYFGIIEQIAIDNIKIREYLDELRSDKTRYPFEKSVEENQNFSEKANQTEKPDRMIDLKIIQQPEIKRKLSSSEVCEKGNQINNAVASSDCLDSSLKEDKEYIKYNKTDIPIPEPKKSRSGHIVKCCYCDESHLKITSKNNTKEESEANIGKVKQNKHKSSLSSNVTNTSNTWPLNKNSLCYVKNAKESPEKSVISKDKILEENKGMVQLRQSDETNGISKECTKGTQAPEELSEQLENCRDESGMEEVTETTEDKRIQSDLPDKKLLDKTKCKICKSSSCNLNKPLSGKYSPATPFKFQCDKLRSTSAKGVGASQWPLSIISCHQSSSQGSGVRSNVFSSSKKLQSSPLNVANDLCKRHLKNCTVHGCLPPARPPESYDEKSCHGGQFLNNASNEEAKVKNGFSCNNLHPGTNAEEEGVTRPIRNNDVEENGICSKTCVSKSRNLETKSEEVREATTHDKILQSEAFRELDTFKNLPKLKEDKNNSKFSNGVFSSSKRKVLALAQEAKRSKEYKFMWSRGGKVFMQKEENSPIVTISNPSDINNL